MISLIRNKFDTTVNQMRPMSPVIRIKGNQRRPLTVFDHTFDVCKGVFSCSGDGLSHLASHCTNAVLDTNFFGY